MPRALVIRRLLRRNATLFERILWSELRDRRLGGFKFRRQHSLGPYVVDFYCPELRLVIELDGAPHDSEHQRAQDTTRTHYFEQRHVRVLRFKNHQVTNNLAAVLQTISSKFPSSRDAERG